MFRIKLAFPVVPRKLLVAVHRIDRMPRSVIENVAAWTVLRDCISIQVYVAAGYAAAEHVRVEPRSTVLSCLWPVIDMFVGTPNAK